MSKCHYHFDSFLSPQLGVVLLGHCVGHASFGGVLSLTLYAALRHLGVS